jgi:hypothetical protein
MNPEDEKAIADAVEARRRKAEEDAAAAQPKCCSLWWQRHTRNCPNRTFDPEIADFWRRIGRLARRVIGL